MVNSGQVEERMLGERESSSGPSSTSTNEAGGPVARRSPTGPLADTRSTAPIQQGDTIGQGVPSGSASFFAEPFPFALAFLAASFLAAAFAGALPPSPTSALTRVSVRVFVPGSMR